MRNKVKVQHTIISNGVTNGDITISGNTIVNGKPSAWIIVLCILTALCFVSLCTISLQLYCESCGEDMPENAILKQGSKGGIYWVDDSGRRHYIDREKGKELLLKQRISQNGSPKDW